MHDSPQHEMILESTHPSGAEEWFCPTCGRRFLMHWPPEYQKIILEPGDEHAMHSGSKGDEYMYMGSLQMNARDAMTEVDDLPFTRPSFEEVEIDDTPPAETLRPWLKGLAGLDLDT